MEVRSFSFDAALTDGFVQLCSTLYAGDRHWIPPMRSSMVAQFAPEFPFYQVSGNEHCHFAALRDGDTIGHVSAFVTPRMRDPQGIRVGCVGLFECVEEYDVAEALLSKAVEWLRTRGGVERIWGPVNFDIWHGYRFKRRGFECGTFLGEPYNRPYYPDFFERFGFTVRRSWSSVELRGRSTIENVVAKAESRYQDLLRRGYRFGRFDDRDPNHMRTLYALVTRSYEGFLGYTPLEFSDFDRIFGPYMRVIDSRFACFVYNPENEAVGFSIAYPDPANAVRAMRGKDNWYAKLQFALRIRSAKPVVFHTIGITPEEVARQHGLGSATAFHTAHAVIDAGYDTLLVALMAEDSLVRKIVGGNIDQADREYILYELTR